MLKVLLVLLLVNSVLAEAERFYGDLFQWAYRITWLLDCECERIDNERYVW
jgi:hypothetical protein